MKKILLILLISSISLSAFAKPNYSYTMDSTQTHNSYQGTYINEEIDVPITQIGLPQQYTQPQIEEKGLEIVWNKWHAKVRNKFSEDIQNVNTPKNYIIATMCTIDVNKNISDVMVVYFPETALTIKSRTAFVKKNSEFYVYMHKNNKYFRTSINSEESFTIGASDKNEQKELSEILASANFKEEIFYKIPYFVFFEPLAEKTQKRQGQSFLKFPELSKRTSIAVACAVTDLKTVATVSKYTADMFNDTERQ